MRHSSLGGGPAINLLASFSFLDLSIAIDVIGEKIILALALLSYVVASKIHL